MRKSRYREAESFFESHIEIKSGVRIPTQVASSSSLWHVLSAHCGSATRTCAKPLPRAEDITGVRHRVVCLPGSEKKDVTFGCL